ncbi:MAG TPA: right-handed parallel beta-helix repeat-containing protein, partial [Methylomirabilota bacterium]|nr:right-handed parallel beta-helix repeat-containing protein [Methylomirabilota bacterium]
NFASGLEAPDDPEARHPSGAVDPRLHAGSRAVDAGVRLPNFNDDFTGKGPDLGCCEVGQPLPHYGPRP